ncbi:anaerobic ribonucleotide reductase-activating protein [uncultured Clostridium sp.]|nr:anaerobic ribonucleotide reductase-activating protein [uncultured Clostridium sp.]
MNYLKIDHEDVCNGDGLRVVLWVAGCSHGCSECQNPQTWNPKSGILFDKSAQDEIFEELEKSYISGITLSGGDPLYVQNLDTILYLIYNIKKKFPTKTIWLYTGFTFNELMDNYKSYRQTPFEYRDDEWLERWEIIRRCDVLVDGPYIKEQRDITLKWRGSSNQRVIDVQETLKQGRIVLYCD